MNNTMIRTAALALAVPGLALASPVAAMPTARVATASDQAVYSDSAWQNGRGRHEGWTRGRGHNDNRYDNYRYDRSGYQTYRGERVYNNTRVWRGNDNRYYCRRQDGTTGLLIGGAVGALLGREVAGNGDRTLGAILGAAGGALLGRSIDKSGASCR
jgi:hypothetical protein